MNDFILQLSGCKVGTKIKFTEERLRYTVQARGNRYLVCNKPFNPRKTVLYCIVDLRNMLRGPENLVFGAGAETREECEDMIDRLEGSGNDNGAMQWRSEISHRRCAWLRIESVEEVAA